MHLDRKFCACNVATGGVELGKYTNFNKAVHIKVAVRGYKGGKAAANSWGGGQLFSWSIIF